MACAKKKIALLSNITVDMVAAKLRGKYDVYIPDGFDTWVQEPVDPRSGFYSGKPDAAIILLDGTEARSWKNRAEAWERLSLWKQALSAATGNITDIPIFLTTIDIRENRIKAYSERKYRLEIEDDWYQFIQGKAEEKGNVYIIDLADVIADIGREQFYSNKMWYMSSMPYSRDGLNAVAAEIERALNAAFTARKKVIALDLDNTLWGGVIGEDGLDGIELSNHKEGQRYYDFQRQFLEMKERGILLAINSKNNPEDVETAIRKHPFMVLREDDFVSSKINWENKAVNLKAMETDLNITEGGFLFIDDNPVERETVKGGCPETAVPEFPDDTAELLPFAEKIWADYCRPLRVLGEDRKKTDLYRNEEKRRQEMSVSLNLEDYIARLGMTVDIHRMREDELDRVAQLCGKTNQFNLTTRRYTAAQVRALAENPDNAVYAVYSSDKYGDNGLISVVILIGSECGVKIDTFLMSCRVMGRKLEDVIIDELAWHYKDRQKMTGEYVPTEKNAPVRDLYDRLGFRLVSGQSRDRIYELDTSEYKKKSFDSYKEIRFKG